MGKVTGFMEFRREMPEERPVAERIRDYRELYQPFPEERQRTQAARCMNCGVPFCHAGCPLGNIVPDWNDLAYRGEWREAWRRLSATNNFPEFTGRLCPAPCEEACVLGINDQPVAIELVEKSIIERAFAEGWVTPEPPQKRTDRRVAVVGSGPSGLACAQQLNRAGHEVTIYERADQLGGLLRYGIPDFKLEKGVIDRRLALMEAEGIRLVPRADAGVAPSCEELLGFDAVVLCGGATKPRDLPIPGRELDGILQAMDFLGSQNRATREGPSSRSRLDAKGKHVIVIGGGDTGSDCVGTATRHGAAHIVNFELMPMPSVTRPEHQPWPFWPMRMRTSSSHKEGGQRFWSIVTKEFIGVGGKLRRLKTVNVDVHFPPGARPVIREIPGTEYEWRADMVMLAMGFSGPDPSSVAGRMGLAFSPQGNVQTDDRYRTSHPGVYAAGDMRRGQSLVVWAISEGRECARCVDQDLMGRTLLPTKGGPDLPRV